MQHSEELFSSEEARSCKKALKVWEARVDTGEVACDCMNSNAAEKHNRDPGHCNLLPVHSPQSSS